MVTPDDSEGRQFWRLHGITIEFKERRPTDVTLKISLEDKKLLWTRKETASAEFTAKGKDTIRWMGSAIPEDIKEFRIDNSGTCFVEIGIKSKGAFHTSLPLLGGSRQTVKVTGAQIYSGSQQLTKTISEYTERFEAEPKAKVKLRFEVYALDLQDFSEITEGLSLRLIDMESVMDQLGCIGDVIETLLAFGKPISELFPIAKVVIGVSDEVFTRVKGQSDCDIPVKYLMSQILGFLGVIPLAEKHPKGIDRFYEKLDDVFVLMLDAMALLKKYAVKERGDVLRFLAGTSEAQSQIEGLGRRFDLLTQEFNRIILLSTDIATHRILRTVQGESEARMVDVVCNWISPLEFGKYQEDVFARRHEGTGVWFLESPEFLNWKEGGSKFLWCPGIPGAGKTVISSIVVNYLLSSMTSQDAVLSIYCNHKEQTEQSLVNLLGSLWKQLVLSQGLLVSLLKSYKDHSKKQSRPTAAELVGSIQQNLEDVQRVYIVVDALDECKKDIAAPLVSSLRSISPKCHLLFTSRPLLTIGKLMQGSSRLDIKANTEDMEGYIRGRMYSGSQLVNLIDSQPNSITQEEVRDAVLTKAAGMFLLVRLHMDALCDQTSIKGLRKQLSQLPSDVDETYNQAMTRIRSQSRSEVELAERVLCWVTFANRPLTVTALQLAVSIESGDEEIDYEAFTLHSVLVSVCAGLVIVDEKAYHVRLVHETTQDFLGRTLPFMNSHLLIAHTCITLLSFSQWEKTEGAPDFTLKTLLGYAALYWAVHARAIQDASIRVKELTFLRKTANVAFNFSIFRGEEELTKNMPSEPFGGGWTGVHLAAYFNLHEALTQLLAEGADVDAVDCSQRSPLTYAVLKRNHESISTLLNSPRFSINWRDFEGRTPLSYAAESGNAAVVKLLLLQQSINCNTRDHSHRSPLSLAAENGHAEVVRLLVDRGEVDVNSRDVRMLTPLLFAARDGHSEVVKELLRKKSLLVNEKDSGGATAFLLAAMNGHNSVIEELLTTGSIDPMLVDSCCYSPLFWAALRGHVDTVFSLLRSVYGKAIPSARQNRLLDEAYVNVLGSPIHSGGNGYTFESPSNLPIQEGYRISPIPAQPLYGQGQRSALENSMVLFSLLSHLGVVVNTYDRHGRSTLSYSSVDNPSLNLIPGIWGSATLNEQDELGRTPLSYAAETAKLDLIHVLLEQNAVPNTFDSSGRSPLSYVAEACEESTVDPRIDQKILNTTLRKLLKRTGVSLTNKCDAYGRTPLSYAVCSGSSTLAQMLLDNDEVHVQKRDKSGRSPLSYAASRGAVELIRQLLTKEGVQIDEIDENNKSILSFAATSNIDAVKLLLKKGIEDVDVCDNEGRSPLSYAVEAGKYDIVGALLDYGANPSQESRTGRSILSYAAGVEDPMTMDLILRALDKHDISAIAERADHSGRTALSFAAESGSGWICRSLNHLNINLDFTDANGRTALSYAAGRGHVSVIYWLISTARVRQDREDNSGRTALSYAAERGHSGAVAALMDYDINGVDKKGRSALSYAVTSQSLETVTLLLSSPKIQVDRKDKDGKTSLRHAVEKGWDDVIALLLSRTDVDANQLDENGQVLLSKAAQDGIKSIVWLFLEQHRVDVDRKDLEGRTPLSFAAEHGHDLIAKALLLRGANPNDRDQMNRTPLSYAASGGSIDIINILLDETVETDSRDELGRTPLSFAAEHGHYPVVEVLGTRGDVDRRRRDIGNRSILSYAAKSGDVQLFKWLLDLDSQDADQENDAGRTPLSYAAMYGNTEIMEILLGRDDVCADSVDHTGRSPFSYAAQRGHLEASILLLKRADVETDRRDHSGRTPLSRAAERGRVEIVRLLLERQDVLVDLEPDNNGKMPMDYARDERRVWDEVLIYDHWDAYDEILLALDARNEAQKRGDLP